MSDERFVELESRLAHQDHLLNTLNDVVTAQQAKLMKLEELCMALVDRLRSVTESSDQRDPVDERPPHY